MYTSDLQLSEMGLRRMEDLPARAGFDFIGRTRGGRDVECRIESALPGVQVISSTSEFDFGTEDSDDLVAWKFRPPQNDFA